MGTKPTVTPAPMMSLPIPVIQASVLPRPEIRPLGDKRYAFKITVPERVYDKLNQARDLSGMGHADTAFSEILEQAIDLYISDRLKKRYAVGAKPKTKRDDTASEKQEPTKPSRAIPAHIRREVYIRDQGRCTFVDHHGRRCSATANLQLHHKVPYAMCKTHHVDLITLHCSTHNQLQARIDFGEALMAERMAQSKTAQAKRPSCST